MFRPMDIKSEPGVSGPLKDRANNREAMKDRNNRAEPISLAKLMQRRSSASSTASPARFHDNNVKLPVINNNDRKERHHHYRDGSMPDSPDTKPPALSSNLSPVSAMPPVTSRPLSTSSSVSGVNGAHSPHSSYNGRTPSPPSMGGTTSAQQLPPACGARQLSKLKRFLTTLQQFGSDISPEIGERVRSLVLGLVNSHLSIEEFHGKLQEATNFPLRPFVIPFLKANLPLLQRELLHCARLAKQTPQQYLAHNEHVLFDPSHSPLESQELLSPEINENGKRRASPDRPKENGIDSHVDVMHPAKRPAMSPVGTNRISPGAPPYNYHMGGQIRLEDISMSREMRERERAERERVERERMERERERPIRGNYHLSDHYDHLERIDDDWKHVENMLHCIVGMVDKCKRALSVLQERSSRDRDELNAWMRRHSDGLEGDMKKRTSEMMASTLRQTDDRVSEVKRRAEEAVHEVKRQAVAELQKAVTAAESKANELVTAERAKMDRAIAQARKQAQEEALATFNHQEEASEVMQSCWNCGRKASETCSGCNIARYCGSFCQHKDWENHHRVCGQNAREHVRGPGVPGAAERTPSSSTSSAAETQVPATSSQATSSAAETSAPATTVTPSPTPVSAPSPAGSTTSNNSRSGSRSSTPAEPAKAEASR